MLMKKYKVQWHTQPAVGSTFYRGTQTVYAANEQDAARKAQQHVWNSTFKVSHPLSHVVIRGAQIVR